MLQIFESLNVTVI